MSIAWIISVELEAEEQFEERLRVLDDALIMYPVEAEAVVSVQTSPTTALSIFVYPDQETADQTLSKREQIMSTAQFKDTFYLEGKVRHLKINKRIYWWF